MSRDNRSKQDRREGSRRAKEARASARARNEQDEKSRAWYAARGIPLDDDNPPVAQLGPVTFYRAFFGG